MTPQPDQCPPASDTLPDASVPIKPGMTLGEVLDARCGSVPAVRQDLAEEFLRMPEAYTVSLTLSVRPVGEDLPINEYIAETKQVHSVKLLADVEGLPTNKDIASALARLSELADLGVRQQAAQLILNVFNAQLQAAIDAHAKRRKELRKELTDDGLWFGGEPIVEQVYETGKGYVDHQLTGDGAVRISAEDADRISADG